MKIFSYDEFSKKIKYHDNLTRILGGLAVITLILVGYNFFSTVIAIFEHNIPARYWLELFISTEGSNDQSTVWLFIYVYGSVILAPTLFIVWMIDCITKEKRIRTLFDIYTTNGDEVFLSKTALTFKINGKKNIPLLIGDKTKERADIIARQIDNMIVTLNKKDLKKLQKKALKINFVRYFNLVSIDQLFPELIVNNHFAFGYLSVKPVAENAIVCTLPNNQRRLYFWK